MPLGLLKKTVLLSCLVVFLNLSILPSWAKDPYVCENCQAKLPSEKKEPPKDKESLIKYFTETFKKSDLYAKLIITAAGSSGNLALCEKNFSKESCGLNTRNIIGLRNFFTGECNSITEPDRRKFCLAFKDGKCSSLSGEQQKRCFAVFHERIDLLEKIQPPPNFDKIDAKKFAVIFIANKICFQRGKEAAVDFMRKYDKDYPELRFFQIAYFMSEEQINRLVNDVALFNTAEQLKDAKVCDEIADPEIKKRCLRPEIKNIEGYIAGEE